MIGELLDSIARAIAWRLPRRVVYWTLMRALAAETETHRRCERVTIWYALARWMT